MSEALATVGARFPCESETIARAYVMPNGPTDRIPVQKVGSTQNRINRQFGVGTTPTHHDVATTAIPRATDEAPPTTSRIAGPADTAPVAIVPEIPPARPQRDPTLTRQIASFLTSAERLIDVGQIEEAKLQIGAVLQLDPGNPKAQRLLEKADAHTTAHPVAPRATEALAAAMAEAEALLARGELAAARELVDRAEAEQGLGRALEDVRARIVKREQQLARDRVLREADDHLRADQPGRGGEASGGLPGHPGGARPQGGERCCCAPSPSSASVRKPRPDSASWRMPRAPSSLPSRVRTSKGPASSCRRPGSAAVSFPSSTPSLGASRSPSSASSSPTSSRSSPRPAPSPTTTAFAEAIDTLEHALALRPQDDGIRRALAATQRAQQRHQREQEAQRAVAEAAARLRGLVASGKLEEAAAELDGGLRGVGRRRQSWWRCKPSSTRRGRRSPAPGPHPAARSRPACRAERLPGRHRTARGGRRAGPGRHRDPGDPGQDPPGPHRVRGDTTQAGGHPGGRTGDPLPPPERAAGRGRGAPGPRPRGVRRGDGARRPATAHPGDPQPGTGGPRQDAAPRGGGQRRGVPLPGRGRQGRGGAAAQAR